MIAKQLTARLGCLRPLSQTHPSKVFSSTWSSTANRIPQDFHRSPLSIGISSNYHSGLISVSRDSRSFSSKSQSNIQANPQSLTPTLRSFTLDGKVALVTGGARGLGLSISRALLEAGAKGLAVLDVREDGGQRAVAELAEVTGAPVVFLRCDVTDEKGVDDAVNQAVQKLGSVDVLVSAAGVAEAPVPAETYPAAAFRRVLDINTTGTFLVAQAVGKHMISRGTGAPQTPNFSMILIASMCARITVKPQEQAAYNASKAGVTALVRSLATEWAPHGIRVNALSPGYMSTDLNNRPGVEMYHAEWFANTPQRRMGDVGDLNGAVVWLASDASKFATGSDVVVDGGYTVW